MDHALCENKQFYIVILVQGGGYLSYIDCLILLVELIYTVISFPYHHFAAS